MQLVLTLAILAALVAADQCPRQPVADVPLRLLLLAGGVAVVTLFAVAASSWTIRRLRTEGTAALRKFRTLQRVHLGLWLLVVGAMLYGLKWPQIVQTDWNLRRWVLIDDLLLLLPVILPLVLSWAVFYNVERALREMEAEGTPGGAVISRRRWLSVHVRHHLGLLLVPILGLLFVQDTVRLLAPGLLETRWMLAVYLTPLVLLFVGFPFLLRWLWQARSLAPGGLRHRLEAAAGRAGVRVRDILVWETGSLVANAAVAGVLPRWRYVFLTDGLIEHLSEEEIEAVFGHEIGHLRHRHLLLRGLAMLAPLSLLLLAEECWPAGVGRLVELVPAAGPAVSAAGAVALLGAVGAYALVVFGGYSRLLEAQADLYGCHSIPAPSMGQAAATFLSALEKLATASGTGRKSRSWQHASMARRAEFLTRICYDPSYENRFARRMRLLRLLVVGAVVSPVLAMWIG